MLDRCAYHAVVLPERSTTVAMVSGGVITISSATAQSCQAG
jgi:hypothetical protein